MRAIDVSNSIENSGLHSSLKWSIMCRPESPGILNTTLPVCLPVYLFSYLPDLHLSSSYFICISNGNTIYSAKYRIMEMTGCQKSNWSSRWSSIITFTCIVNIHTVIHRHLHKHTVYEQLTLGWPSSRGLLSKARLGYLCWRLWLNNQPSHYARRTGSERDKEVWKWQPAQTGNISVGEYTVYS